MQYFSNVLSQVDVKSVIPFPLPYSSVSPVDDKATHTDELVVVVAAAVYFDRKITP